MVAPIVLRQAGHPLDRNALIEEHLGFARLVAARLCARLPRCVDLEELESDAYLGLMQAAEGFDPERKVLFRTYAARRILGAMLDGLREREAIRLMARPSLRSLDVEVADEEGHHVTLADLIADDSKPVGVEIEMREEVDFVLRCLPRPSRRLLIDHHVRGLQQKDIAVRLGISASGVSQRLREINRRVERIRCRSRR